MSYIAPNGTIRILKNIPLTNDYVHTMLFGSASAQSTYFIGKTERAFTHQSYTRLERGKIRVNVCADEIYACNYLMYQNTGFGNKWFYAFITKIEYINNVTSEIRFEIDVMQTWHFDYSLLTCFVERQHSATDIIGANYEAEPIELGEYIFNDYEKITMLSGMRVMVEVVDVTEAVVEGTLIDGIYSGAKITVFDTDTAGISALDNFISGFRDRPDAVLTMYMAPAILTAGIASGHTIEYSSAGETFLAEADAISNSTTIDGYLPRNKKLLTYPYNFYHVDNASGNGAAFRYEFFQDWKPSFRYGGGIAPPISIVLRPRRYKRVSGTLKNESLSITNFPLCSWNTDAYKAWLAQNAIPLGLESYSRAVQGDVSSVFSRHPVGSMVNNEIGITANILSQKYRASIQADICKGNLYNGNVNCSLGTQDFYGGRMSITSQEARRIDNFFDVYGYATNRLIVPDRSSRPYYNYVKTATCHISGSVGREDEAKICEIYNKGITFWHGDGISYTGNYAVAENNTPS